MRIVLIAFVLLLIATAGAGAQTLKQTKDKTADAMLDQTRNQLVLTMVDGLSPPAIRPKLANIRRSYTPSADPLITKFLGGKQTLIGSGQSIISPIWGKGTRYKSGTVIYAVSDKLAQQKSWDLRSMPKLESVPAWLDVYPSGFLYTNNITHKGVIQTQVKVKGETDADVSYKTVYSPKDGQATVEQMLPGMVGQLTVPKGFRKSLSHMVQNYGERLYAYHLNPEYLTTYPVFDKDGKTQIGEKPIAVPVLDSYVHVLLDGDKVLAGMEYFWDNNLQIQGDPKPCMQCAEAIIKAKGWLLQRYNGSPPFYNVSNVRLGFVQDRKDRSLLVPAWIFDAWYVVPLPSSSGTDQAPVKHETDTFAVNALTGEAFDLAVRN